MSLFNYLAGFLLSLTLSNYVLETNCEYDNALQYRINSLERAALKASCQKYIAHGYHYEHMYDLNGVALDNTVVVMKNDKLERLEMHIAIKSIQDGIILLSPTRHPGPNDLVFEFAVGINYGMQTVLRLRKEGVIGRDEVARVDHDKLLFANKYTKFYIRIGDDTLRFGKEGEKPIISYYDVRLRSIKYFDMSSYSDLYAKFLYDCQY